MTDSRINLSTVIITYNEERKLADCLKSVRFSDEMIIIDSYSTDRTKEIAAQHQTQFHLRQLDNFSAQKNYGIKQAKGNWILLIDADERVTDKLKGEIQNVILNSQDLVGYYVRRENFIFGKRLRYGANLQDYQLRLIRKNEGVFEGAVHERIKPTGKTGVLKGPLVHLTYQTMEDYFAKFNLFSSLDARQLYEQNKKPNWFKTLLLPLVAFIYFYIFKLGFLDGKTGLVYQILSSFYIFIRNVKAMRYFEEES